MELRRGSTYKSALLNQDGPVLLGLSSIARNGGFKRDALKTYGGDSPKEITLAPGDLYVSLKDVTQTGDLLGAVARLPNDVPRGRLTQDTVKLIFRGEDPEEIDYVYWLLHTPQYREYCRSHAIGVTTLALPRDDFLAFPVPLRTPQGGAIVKALRALDAKMGHNVRFVPDLMQVARGFYRAEPKQSVELGNIATLEKGLSYNGSGLADSGVPMFNLANFTTDGWGDRSALKFYVGEFRDRHRVERGEILLANTDLTQRRAILGQPLLVPSGLADAIFTHHVSAVRMKSGYERFRLGLYLALQTRAFRDRAETYASGTTVAALPRDAVLAFEAPLPAEERLDAFNSVIEALIERAEAAEHESATLAAMKDALLPKLISGEIRVPGSYDPNDVLGAVAAQAGVAA